MDKFNVNMMRAKKRSTFEKNQNIKTTFNIGDIIPFYIDEILPGDTMEMQTNLVARLSPQIGPTMDTLFIDTYFFWVPNRIIWKDWKTFMGENTRSKWTQKTILEVPKVTYQRGIKIGTIADYMGIPINSTHLQVSQLPFRAYVKIYNDWFRDENLQEPLMDRFDINSNVNIDNQEYDDKLNYAVFGITKPIKAGKYKDYFTSALPQPQKGEDITLSVIAGAQTLPVFTKVLTHDKGAGPIKYITEYDMNNNKLKYTLRGYDGITYVDNGEVDKNAIVNGRSKFQKTYKPPNNLWTDIPPTGKGFTINEFRLAIQTQALLEVDAKSGTRYTEILKGHFGVSSDDTRLQRPELLQASKSIFRQGQIIQTSSTDTTSPLGTVAAVGQTANQTGVFKKSFKEHGYIIGIVIIRHKQSYNQGVNKMWLRNDRLDFYWPELANIGEQPILKAEIKYEIANKNQIFGYQEAWANYKYKPDLNTGHFRSGHDKTLDTLHYGTNFTNTPVLNYKFIQQSDAEVDRTLAIQSKLAHQVIMDIYVICKATRMMPLFSNPAKLESF